MADRILVYSDAIEHYSKRIEGVFVRLEPASTLSRPRSIFRQNTRKSVTYVPGLKCYPCSRSFGK